MNQQTFWTQGKALLESKTFWFAVLSVAIWFAAKYGFDVNDPTYQNTIDMFGPVAMAVGQILIRLITSGPITSLAGPSKGK